MIKQIEMDSDSNHDNTVILIFLFCLHSHVLTELF